MSSPIQDHGPVGDGRTADGLELQGRHDEAVAPFERLLAVGDDLGLFAEDDKVPAKPMAGNVPQALTHLAIVDTALSRGA